MGDQVLAVFLIRILRNVMLVHLAFLRTVTLDHLVIDQTIKHTLLFTVVSLHKMRGKNMVGVGK